MRQIPKFINAEVDVCYLKGVEFVSRIFMHYDTVQIAQAIYIRACEKYKDGGALISLKAHYDTGTVTMKTFLGDYDALFAKMTAKKGRLRFDREL